MTSVFLTKARKKRISNHFLGELSGGGKVHGYGLRLITWVFRSNVTAHFGGYQNRSRSTGIVGHDAPESAVTFAGIRNIPLLQAVYESIKKPPLCLAKVEPILTRYTDHAPHANRISAQEVLGRYLADVLSGQQGLDLTIGSRYPDSARTCHRMGCREDIS